MTPWEQAIDRVLRSLEPGEVVTYGEVALEAGRPGAARSVGTFLARAEGAYAWWRVVSASGRLVPGHEAEQARRLRQEQVVVDEARWRVELANGPVGSPPCRSTTTPSAASTAPPSTSTTTRTRLS